MGLGESIRHINASFLYSALDDELALACGRLSLCEVVVTIVSSYPSGPRYSVLDLYPLAAASVWPY